MAEAAKMELDRVDELEARLLQLQIDTIKRAADDHERRIRELEEVATEFRLLKYLTMGGGAIGIVNLAGMAYLIFSHGGP